jgi:hypothetical protein
LEERSQYLLRERSANGGKGKPQWIYKAIQLAAYDPCPAFVIVQTEFGRRWRCLREDIFFIPPASDFLDTENFRG